MPDTLFDPAESFDAALLDQARDVLGRCSDRKMRIATAESCTGGLVAACLTSVPGYSSVTERGFVTYSNDAKTDMLDVPAALIESHGAVSQPVAEAMAAGAIARSRADLAVSLTGVAGPTGGSAEKPVGTVWIGVCRRGQPPRAQRFLFPGSRAAVRLASVRAALDLLRQETEAVDVVSSD